MGGAEFCIVVLLSLMLVDRITQEGDQDPPQSLTPMHARFPTITNLLLFAQGGFKCVSMRAKSLARMMNEQLVLVHDAHMNVSCHQFHKKATHFLVMGHLHGHCCLLAPTSFLLKLNDVCA